MRKSLAVLIAILLVFLAISGWAAFKLFRDNRDLKKEASTLKQRIVSLNQQQSGSDTVNFVPSASVKEIYDFAQENQGLLKKIDCYCGCENPMHQPYHKSLANCFVKEITNDGRIIYDSHGQNCKTCIDEAKDVRNWLNESQNYQSIKNLIDGKYKAPK